MCDHHQFITPTGEKHYEGMKIFCLVKYSSMEADSALIWTPVTLFSFVRLSACLRTRLPVT
jgi:hypothetical protein